MHEYIRGIYRVLREYTTYNSPPIVSVGELARCPDQQDVLEYISAGHAELDRVLQPDISWLGNGRVEGDLSEPWSLSDLKCIVSK
jgi:hypothetical protein